MLLNKKGGFQLLPNVEDPKYIVFCDFDETYYPHSMSHERQKDLYELENYLEAKSINEELVFGWVTGSSTESILHKMEQGGFRFFPHFIASDLGTESPISRSITFWKVIQIGIHRLVSKNLIRGKSMKFIMFYLTAIYH